MQWQVNLGVIESSPSSTAGVIEIMQVLQEYCPETQDGYHAIPAHGDVHSVERMLDARQARANGNGPKARLEGMEPVPQEFHKRCVLLQVYSSSTN